MRRNVEQLVFANIEDIDSDIDEEVIAYQTKQKLENEEKVAYRQNKALQSLIENKGKRKKDRLKNQKEQSRKCKEKKKFKNLEEELFSNDEFIQTNKDIKRKWYIQSINNLRKVEKRFRKMYLNLE